MFSIQKKGVLKEKKYAIGIDLGGTKIGVAMVSRSGEIKNYLKIPTNAQEGMDAVLAKIKTCINQVIQYTGIHIGEVVGIGIGVPGQVNPEDGIVHFAPNLPGWQEIPISRVIEEEFNLPVMLENDANAAAWGEKSFGIARGIDNLVCLTLGTGIGGGLILDGKIYRGKNFAAGEIGHIIVNKDGPQCNCGGSGCLEVYSSATGIKNRVIERVKRIKKDHNPLQELISDLESIHLAEIFEMARQGEPLLKDIVNDAIEYLGIGIIILVNLLNPEMVVLVGGLTNEGDKLLDPLKEIVYKRAIKVSLKDLKIVFGQLGEYAGLIGAAAQFWL